MAKVKTVVVIKSADYIIDLGPDRGARSTASRPRFVSVSPRRGRDRRGTKKSCARAAEDLASSSRGPRSAPTLATSARRWTRRPNIATFPSAFDLR
ncbi:MAG: hypothetical protein U9N48_01360 [Euryarchaeota archaeon]|nr:hypothetical protein [Euryarchaeota archaeon]